MTSKLVMEEDRDAWHNPVFSLGGAASPSRLTQTKLDSELAPLVKFSEFASLVTEVGGPPLKQLKLKDKLNFTRLRRERQSPIEFTEAQQRKIVLPFELWRSHIKQVEGHFGTAVASYFVLLRWLFYMNVIIFGVWTLFVSIPQFVVEPSLGKEHLPCIKRNDSYKCSHSTTVLLLPGNCTISRGVTKATLCSNKSAAVITIPMGTKPTTICNKSSLEFEKWYQCPAYLPSFGSPVDLVTGRGGYNDTVLFLGHYSKLTVYNGISYNRPVAILVCTAVVFGISFIMLITRLVQTGKKLSQRKATQTDFCNKVFGSWDFGIVNPSTTALRKKCIRRDIQLVLLSTNAKGLLVPILIIFSIIALPIVFHIIGGFERYKSRSGHAKMTLIRSAIVRITTLVIYIIAAYAAIQCTQSIDLQVAEFNVTMHNTTFCQECWETFVGQQFYQLLLLEFLFIALFTVVLETVRNLAHKAFYKRVQKKFLKVIFSKPTFILPDSILDLVYFQLLLWLGFLFSPLQPLFMVIILVIMFYLKKFSVMWNLEPEEDLFRGSTVMFLSLVMLFAVYVFAVSLVGYAIIGLKPSSNCGPFQNQSSMISVLTL
eukprot:Em0017g407a